MLQAKVAALRVFAGFSRARVTIPGGSYPRGVQSWLSKQPPQAFGAFTAPQPLWLDHLLATRFEWADQLLATQFEWADQLGEALRFDSVTSSSE